MMLLTLMIQASSRDHGLGDNPQRKHRVANHQQDERQVSAPRRSWGVVAINSDVVSSHDRDDVSEDDESDL